MTEEKEKVIFVEYNGYEWYFPAHLVAHNRAKHYHDISEDSDKKENFISMYRHSMENPEVMVDWFISDMNWSDVSKLARLSKQPFVLEPDMSEANIRVGYKTTE